MVLPLQLSSCSPQTVVLAKNARLQMEIIIFSGLVAGLKNSFHILFFRLTNEVFFDIEIISMIPLKSLQSSSMKGGD
jgi:hypothetical protein